MATKKGKKKDIKRKKNSQTKKLPENKTPPKKAPSPQLLTQATFALLEGGGRNTAKASQKTSWVARQRGPRFLSFPNYPEPWLFA